MSVYQMLWSFFIYGFIGWCVEVAFAAIRQKKYVNRGFLNGPMCPIYGVGIICVVQILSGNKEDIWILYLLSVVVATILELLTGICLEKLFSHRWWDYSGIPGNIKGYVCPIFSAAWGVACVIVICYIHPAVENMIGFIPLIAGKLLLFIFLATLIADIGVTVNSILNLNLRLRKMQEITEDLERLSVLVGEGISKNVIDGMEKQEQIKLRLEENKEKYRELLEMKSFGHKRLLQAFPKMKSIQYKNQFQELKEEIQNRMGKSIEEE